MNDLFLQAKALHSYHDQIHFYFVIQLMLVGTWSSPAAALLEPSVRSTPVNSYLRTQSFTALDAWGGFKQRDHRYGRTQAYDFFSSFFFWAISLQSCTFIKQDWGLWLSEYGLFKNWHRIIMINIKMTKTKNEHSRPRFVFVRHNLHSQYDSF